MAAPAAAADLKISLLLSLLLLLNSVATQSAPRLSSPTESRALLDLRSSLGISAKNWHKKANPCLNWTGIECRNGRVFKIKLTELRRTVTAKLNPRFAVDSLPNFPFLSTFNSSGFLLPGQIPEWFGAKLSNLQVLDLSSSSISGPIPLSLGSLNKLRFLNLSHNSITGNIPTALENLHSLLVLDLSQNSITGQISSSISSLGNLTNLDLSSNYLSGAIPLDFALLSSLERLNLSRNSLSSSIPAQFGNLSKMEQLDLGFNSLSGTLPHELGRLEDLKFLDVSRNNLTGFFPNFTASDFNVTGAVFNFSYNLFYGNLTSVFANARLVDLSSNYFLGQAPNGSSFRLSDNCFSGIDKQRKFHTCSEFYADVGVPYGNGGSSPQPMPPPLVQRTKRKTRLPYVIMGVFGGFSLVLIVVAALLLLLLRSRKARGTNQQVQSPNVGGDRDVEQPPKVLIKDLSCLGEAFTFEQLVVATGSFSTENLIKKGSSGWLYRAVLEGGSLAVVKKVDLHSNIRKESFMLELEFFCNVAHQRVVPLIGHCLDDEGVKFLVYKYMPNGDLSNALYRMTSSEEGLQSLDWITRLKIAIGAAEALSYLHNECTPPLVHRDIQASSILLDDKYEVRLGSFSEVCASGATNHQNMFSRLLWTPQTSGRRPSGSSSATCAYDVYCFGKVLLELVSGKLGMSKLNDNEAKQWLDNNLAFISIYEKEKVNKIVDQSLIIDEDLLEEVWAVAVVAKSCLNPKASRRPSMRHVVKALENPFKVVRDENFSSGRLSKASSRQSWTAALFGSWHRTSSDSSNMSTQTNKEIIGGLRQPETVGSRGGSGTIDHSSSHKRSSSDVFPEPVETQDVESAN